MIRVFAGGLAGVLAAAVEVVMVHVAYGTIVIQELPLWISIVIGVSLFGGLIAMAVGVIGAIIQEL